MSFYAKSRLVISLAALILFSLGSKLFAVCVVVDDMENYTPWAYMSPKIYQIWIDGPGDCQPGAGNNTGSTLEAFYELPGGGGFYRSGRTDLS